MVRPSSHLDGRHLQPLINTSTQWRCVLRVVHSFFLSRVYGHFILKKEKGGNNELFALFIGVLRIK